MKVERVSYDVMTPGAARNILQAILWKPAIDWKVSRIDVIRPIRWVSLRRNEVKSRAIGKPTKAMLNGEADMGIIVEDDRQQRAGLFLKDVEYVIHGSFELTSRASNGDNELKFREQFQRRASRGQCAWQPYLGCREFSAYFELVTSSSDKAPIEESRDLGWMLYDLDFADDAAQPVFFNASLQNGSLVVPDKNSEAVRR
jgi:CRISPR-associated protein Cas5d